MRELLIIPIIHAASDLGRLQEPIDRVKNGLMDEPSAAKSRSGVDAFWESLQVGFQSWQFDFSNLLVFQDALPVGPSNVDPIEPKIVKELAAKGSVNHQLIESLVQRGATLVGTENPDLLLKEYALVKQFLDLRLNEDSESGDEESGIAKQQAEILVQRDQFIADRIDKSLVAPQSGLIFLGMLHRLEEYLPGDIQVRYPFGKPSNQQQDSFSG